MRANNEYYCEQLFQYGQVCLVDYSYVGVICWKMCPILLVSMQIMVLHGGLLLFTTNVFHDKLMNEPRRCGTSARVVMPYTNVLQIS